MWLLQSLSQPACPPAPPAASAIVCPAGSALHSRTGDSAQHSTARLDTHPVLGQHVLEAHGVLLSKELMHATRRARLLTWPCQMLQAQHCFHCLHLCVPAQCPSPLAAAALCASELRYASLRTHQSASSSRLSSSTASHAWRWYSTTCRQHMSAGVASALLLRRR